MCGRWLLSPGVPEFPNAYKKQGPRYQIQDLFYSLALTDEKSWLLGMGCTVAVPSVVSKSRVRA